MITALFIFVGIPIIMLCISFILLFLSLQTPTKSKFFLLLILYLGLLTPITYMLYDNQTQEYQDANIGLGLAMLFTWAIAIAGIIFGLLKYKNRQK